MNVISVVIIGFIVPEASNVVALYRFPGSTYANSVGVFKAWEKTKKEPEIHAFVKYLVDWVAGTKLILLLLLLAILFTADDRDLFYTGVALVISISSFWRPFPLVRNMDRADQIAPKNYSAMLGLMISAFVLVFVIALLLAGGG